MQTWITSSYPRREALRSHFGSRLYGLNNLEVRRALRPYQACQSRHLSLKLGCSCWMYAWTLLYYWWPERGRREALAPFRDQFWDHLLGHSGIHFGITFESILGSTSGSLLDPFWDPFRYNFWIHFGIHSGITFGSILGSILA